MSTPSDEEQLAHLDARRKQRTMNILRQEWPIRGGTITLTITTDTPITAGHWASLGPVVERIAALAQDLKPEPEGDR